MRECPKCMSWWDGDTCPICEVQLMSEYSNNDGSDGVFAEPVPEPQPKFANIKVGDWVEHLNGTHLLVIAIEEPANIKSPHIKDRTPKFRCNNRNTYSAFDGSCIYDEDRIVKILSPKEVIVDFGSGISGTIEKDKSTESIWVRMDWIDPVARIWLNHLDPQTRHIVESILKAQEEA